MSTEQLLCNIYNERNNYELNVIHKIIEQTKVLMTDIFINMSITNKEFFILNMIIEYKKNGRKITSTEISNAFSISRAAVSQFVSSLEKRGFILRTTSRNDRRKTYLEITEKGRETISETEKHLDGIFDTVKTKLGGERFETLICLLDDISKIITEVSLTAENT